MKSIKAKKWQSKFIWLILFVLIYSLFIEPNWINTKSYNIDNPSIPNVFSGKKIIFLSDFHCGAYYSPEKIRNIVEKTNKLKPDLILLGGDYMDASPSYIEPFFDELKNLQAPLGIYGVLGNHDRSRRDTEVKKNILQAMTKANIKPLNNDAGWINLNGNRIKIGGIGDLRTDRVDLTPTVKDVQANDFVILLSHNPDFAENLMKDKIYLQDSQKVDLMVSGHNHGGQLNLFGFWAPILPSNYGQKYVAGRIKTNFGEVIVSKGVGTTILPMRFFARPEITILNLRKF